MPPPQSIVEGVDKLTSKLERLAKAHDPRVRLTVGYKSPYAVYVHENREMILEGEPRPSGIGVYWGPRGRAGFLLDVFREMSRDLFIFGKSQLQRGITLKTALYWIGRRLIKESQRNVPVEYGDLHDSAFVEVETT